MISFLAFLGACATAVVSIGGVLLGSGHLVAGLACTALGAGWLGILHATLARLAR